VSPKSAGKVIVGQFMPQDVLDIHADGSARGRPAASTFVQAQRNVTIDALKAASGPDLGQYEEPPKGWDFKLSRP